MTSSHGMPTTYYPWFDWLRAFLAIVVMLGHDKLISWSHAGDLAVKVFFAMSGWLIGGVLLHTSREDLPRFFFNRAVRIWAPYGLALLLLVGASLLRDPVTGKWAEFVFYKLTFVYNWFGTSQLATSVSEMPLRGTGNHFWSVNAEEQFYLLAPLLLVLLPDRMGRSIAVWGALAWAAWLSEQYASIFFGVVAAIITHSMPGALCSVPARALLALALLTSSIALAFELHYERVAPFLALCVVLLLAVPGPRKLAGEIAGGMSYPLYLNHWIGVYVANAALQPFGLRGSVLGHVLSNVLNVLLAVALYWYFDRRLLARRSDWYSPWRGRCVTGVAYLMVATGLVVGGTLLLVRTTG